LSHITKRGTKLALLFTDEKFPLLRSLFQGLLAGEAEGLAEA
jgi:hypothetical protein